MNAEPRIERRRSEPPSRNGMDVWKWIAAIVGALLVGLTPFLLSLSAQRDYAQKDDLAAVATQVVALSERIARNEEQIQQATDSIGALLDLARTGEDRLSSIEAVLARIEAVLNAQTPETANAPP